MLPEERKTGGKVAVTVFVTALLDFVGLAALLPILYYLLEGGENRQAALWFSLLAVGIIVFKGLLVVGFSRFQNRYLLSLYRRLSIIFFSTAVLLFLPRFLKSVSLNPYFLPIQSLFLLSQSK